MSGTVRNSIPSQYILDADGFPTHRPVIDPRVGMSKPINLESFHFFEPGLEEFLTKLNEYSECPVPWIRKIDDTNYEMLTTLANVVDTN